MAAPTIRSALRSSFSASSSSGSGGLVQTIRGKKSLSKPHEFSKASEFLGSWDVPKDPREAEKKLALLRRDYGKQVKELRKQYFYEMELQRQEKQLQDRADRESILRAREERKAAKAALAEEQAAERKVFEDDLRQTLLKEREQKLQNWRAKEEMTEQKKDEKKELLRRQSSTWINEEDLAKRILEAVADPRLL
ncbi:hypothetical protein ACLOJK_034068 [Asimina triloba]